MKPAHTHTPAELIFPPQAPFSWTLRWACAHRSGGKASQQHAFRVIASTRSAEALSATVAFAREHDAQLELD